MEERFKKARNAYVDTVLMNDDGEDPVDGTIRELEDFRSKAHISWRPATDYTADHLVPFLQKEAKKSPAYRKARSEEHTSELKSLMRISYAVFCLKNKNIEQINKHHSQSRHIYQ